MLGRYRAPKPRQPYRRMSASGVAAARRIAALRSKKGRTGTKRRSRAAPPAMRRYAAPVAVGTVARTGKRGPAAVGYKMQQISDTCTRIIGRAYVGEVNTTGMVVAGNKANALGLIFDINPSLLNDRVAVIASTFQKYVYQGVKFTYVPQCSTATSGSIGLVFDRDPLEISANTQGTQFLAEVMSYEHATLTPAYVETSTSYSRDPKELKTWFLGAPDATLTTRETSQGNLLVYGSNVLNDTGYGFIIMDYVLDLIAPSVLPNKQNITQINAAPSQWVNCCNGANIGAAGNAINIAGTTRLGFTGAPNWWANFDSKARKAGVVGELHLGGSNEGALVPPSKLGNWSIGAGSSTDAQGTPITSLSFKCGQKLYFATHAFTDAASGVALIFSWHTSLSSARAAVSEFQTTSLGPVNPNIVPDQIFVTADFSAVVAGWARLIAEGAGSEDNA